MATRVARRWYLLSLFACCLARPFRPLSAISAPFAADRATAPTLRELHELCANGILIVAGIHALAALYHHFIAGTRSWPECCCREIGSGRISSRPYGLAVVADPASPACPSLLIEDAAPTWSRMLARP
ncbi:hypothetical protein [Mesorhizobium sp. WSM3860]|uniref:hypothetical protein n=1 Tax=Mesorhizobium sp. WSM3860 TaxID=2029403 RepID=UPI001140FE01|nr:hypothetical protein [Mesorhizobium sp. WSM3860]